MTLNPDYPTTSEGGTKETARQEAGRLGAEAQGAARDVAGTARDEARHVKDEAVGQARSLAESAKQEATSQLSTQKDRLAVQSRGISEDLERISRGERPESDLVNQAVAMLSDRARRVTHHLESREPMDLLDDVRRFAARRPGTFLAIAAGIGLVAGRMTRGLKDAHDDGPRHAPTRTPTSPGPVPVGRVPGTVYPEDAAITGGRGGVGQVPVPPAVPPTIPPTVAGTDLGTGAPAADEILGTPAAQRPYDAGRPDAGGRP
ncbi:hypothetical protein [Citricoccus sp.]|uniref:hypothetical protein n=1 Tax=Citricoccus sp. TaxID=1978372 RepID=UPI0026115676|nr:hypothetical protein [Citricoccus sp.]HRO30761.1 hypothetical protein [Citricoccus sp.]